MHNLRMKLGKQTNKSKNNTKNKANKQTNNYDLGCGQLSINTIFNSNQTLKTEDHL